ncbi:Pup--protein ligase, partial [Actinomadura sp. DSM 109109]|nr:Pup--protein ligase [Actinomadura lepetitiana]
GRVLDALQIQREYYEKTSEFLAAHGAHNALVPRIMDLWNRTLSAIEDQDTSGIDTEIDWAIKKKLLDSYQAKHGLAADSPRLAQIDLAYHDISPSRGLFYLLQNRGAAARVLDGDAAQVAVEAPPNSTRAALRGRFVRAAQAAGRDYT